MWHQSIVFPIHHWNVPVFQCIAELLKNVIILRKQISNVAVNKHIRLKEVIWAYNIECEIWIFIAIRLLGLRSLCKQFIPKRSPLQRCEKTYISLRDVNKHLLEYIYMIHICSLWKYQYQKTFKKSQQQR